ncbi:MAG: lamin tail domain-containing protein, partial [Bacteroidetes bacterium]|nr:lamin tail domain-containing protein [Bacteroidota bacterium]
QLYTDSARQGNYVLEGTVLDTTYFMTRYFGLSCIYTSTRSEKFWFDDLVVSGKPFIDTTAPIINSLQLINHRILQLGFSEDLDSLSAVKPKHFTLEGGEPSSVDWIDDRFLRLVFTDPFKNGKRMLLNINGVEDHFGNLSKDTISFVYYRPQRYDVLITEIMADPEPVVGLPEVEYVELLNNTDREIDLFDWSLHDGSNEDQLSHYMLEAGNYLILCDDNDESVMKEYGDVLSLASFPSLTNSGERLSLYSDSGDLIHTVNYSESWYGNLVKQQGGWSLEMIDTHYPCLTASNWNAAEVNSGGTPGAPNSTSYMGIGNYEAPILRKVIVHDEQNLEVQFTGMINDTGVKQSNFKISHSINHPLSVSVVIPELDKVMLLLNKPLKNGIVYELTIENIYSCNGEPVASNQISYGIPETAERKDLLINEILFNPFPYGVDFVEVLNNSSKVIDLGKLLIGSQKADSLDDLEWISTEPHYILPGELNVLTVDPLNVQRNYPSNFADRFLKLDGLPTFPDTSGTVILLSQAGDEIDRLEYVDDWHFDLLNAEGVSLERIDKTALTQDEFNWHSASSIVGYATPGMKNSQDRVEKILNEEVSISPTVFSPDGDGVDDIVEISFLLERSGYVASVMIYDRHGRPVTQLLDNNLLSTKTIIFWDGLKDNGMIADVGIYIMMVELFKLNGYVKKYKLPFVLAKRL